MNLNERADEEEEDEYGRDPFIGAEEEAESEEMDEEILFLRKVSFKLVKTDTHHECL